MKPKVQNCFIKSVRVQQAVVLGFRVGARHQFRGYPEPKKLPVFWVKSNSGVTKIAKRLPNLASLQTH